MFFSFRILLLLLVCCLYPRAIESIDIGNASYFNVSDCLAFFTKGVTFGSVILPPTQTFDKGECQKDKSILDFSYSNVGDIDKLSISLAFANSKNGFWSVSSAKVSAHCKASSNKCENIDDGDLDINWASAPSHLSYKCTNPPNARIRLKDKSWSKLSFNFLSLQVQPFGVDKGRFGDVSDCAGYFTIEILSVLFISFLLLVILIFAIQMLFSVKSCELYDDPRTTKLIQLGADN